MAQPAESSDDIIDLIIIILPRTTDGHAIETSSIGPAPEEADVWSRTRIIRFAEGETRIDPTTVHLPHNTLQPI